MNFAELATFATRVWFEIVARERLSGVIQIIEATALFIAVLCGGYWWKRIVFTNESEMDKGDKLCRFGISSITVAALFVVMCFFNDGVRSFMYPEANAALRLVGKY